MSARAPSRIDLWLSRTQSARRVASQMPNAIGTMPSRSSHDTGSLNTSQPNSKPSGGIRKCSALARWRGQNHEPQVITANRHGHDHVGHAPEQTGRHARRAQVIDDQRDRHHRGRAGQRLDAGGHPQVRGRLQALAAACPPPARSVHQPRARCRARLPACRSTRTQHHGHAGQPSSRPSSLRQLNRSPSTGPASTPISSGLVLISTAVNADDTRVMPDQLKPRYRALFSRPSSASAATSRRLGQRQRRCRGHAQHQRAGDQETKRQQGHRRTVAHRDLGGGERRTPQQAKRGDGQPGDSGWRIGAAGDATASEGFSCESRREGAAALATGWRPFCAPPHPLTNALFRLKVFDNRMDKPAACPGCTTAFQAPPCSISICCTASFPSSTPAASRAPANACTAASPPSASRSASWKRRWSARCSSATAARSS